MKQLMAETNQATLLAKQARKEGVLSLMENALNKVAQGITSLEEVYRVTDF
jgi:type II secretory ATPase GspE/PulE/Tfp pilus assembly ATPase PilB-like protein